MDPSTVPNRDEQHGGMEAVGEIAQTLKHRMRGTLNWERLSRGEREALDMIAHKIARILSGADPHDLEHWRDLAGYAIAARRADSKALLTMPNPKFPAFLTECIIIAVFTMAIITPLLVPVWLFYMDAASHGYIPGISSPDVIQQLFTVPR